MAVKKKPIAKAVLVIELAVLKKELEIVRTQLEAQAVERERLISMVEGLQRALVAKESPRAYHDQRMAELVENPQEEEERLRRQAVSDGVKDYIKYQEDPLWEDADQMVSSLVGVIGAPESPPILADEG